ncbi:MAG: hypothetical protein CL521_04685 [Actinobacteria bacterium]|nr:hypothetical protein [Actinomycetota bacterium]
MSLGAMSRRVLIRMALMAHLKDCYRSRDLELDLGLSPKQMSMAESQLMQMGLVTRLSVRGGESELQLSAKGLKKGQQLYRESRWRWGVGAALLIVLALGLFFISYFQGH